MTTEGRGEPLSVGLIERYLRTRARRYFRGQHDREYFYIAIAGNRRLYVHLENSAERPDVFTISVTPTSYFPADDRDRLMEFAGKWNAQDHEVTARVQGSSDPHRLGVVARTSHRAGDRVRFEPFASFVDRTTTSAMAFFDELARVVELPASPAQSLVRDAG